LPGYVTIIGKLIAVGISQHAGMGLDAQIRRRNRSLDHPGKARR
jgi:hypothetical protein